MKTLIVDDSRSSRVMVKSCLKELPCEIDEAESGEIAINKFQIGQFDLVIMDIHMPNLDGYETTKRIRAMEIAEKSMRVPIIALTAMDPDQAVAKTKAAGATTCLSKPVKQSALLDAIRAVSPALGAASSHRRRFQRRRGSRQDGSRSSSAWASSPWMEWRKMGCATSVRPSLPRSRRKSGRR
jgi:CheY-like chemotaxis protein